MKRGFFFLLDSFLDDKIVNRLHSGGILKKLDQLFFRSKTKLYACKC